MSDHDKEGQSGAYFYPCPDCLSLRRRDEEHTCKPEDVEKCTELRRLAVIFWEKHEEYWNSRPSVFKARKGQNGAFFDVCPDCFLLMKRGEKHLCKEKSREVEEAEARERGFHAMVEEIANATLGMTEYERQKYITELFDS